MNTINAQGRRFAHPDCQRAITYEGHPKTLNPLENRKLALYRCSNSRKVHSKGDYVSEKGLWEQFEPAIEALSISEEFAQDITNALNETHDKQKAAIKKQMEGFRSELEKLREERANGVKLLAAGKISEVNYAEFAKDVERREDHYVNEVERLTLTISDEAMVSVKKVFELAINAKELWKSMNREDRLEYLKNVCLNPNLDGLTLQFQLQSPFARRRIGSKTVIGGEGGI